MLLSSVVSQISAEELTFAGNFLRSRTFRDFEIYGAIAVIYIAIALSFKLLAHLLHRNLFKFTRLYLIDPMEGRRTAVNI